MVRVAVLGAGIIGLWTAEVLVDRGFEVEIHAAGFNPNHTSAAAVCVLTPFFPSEPSSAEFQRGIRWAADTLEHVRNIRDGKFLQTIDCYEFGANDLLEDSFPLWKLDHLDFTEFEVIRLDRAISGLDFAVCFEAQLCSTQPFLEYLTDKLLGSGVAFNRTRIEDLQSFSDATDFQAYVNCMGYNQATRDSQLYPVVGQSMMAYVAGFPGPHFGIAAGDHAMFRHQNGLYIGSYFRDELEPGAPRRDLYEESIIFIHEFLPELCDAVGLPTPEVDWSVLSRVNAGIRPFRRTGPRIEIELFNGTPIVHNYGHGAHGWTIGFASSVHAANLVEEAIGIQGGYG